VFFFRLKPTSAKKRGRSPGTSKQDAVKLFLENTKRYNKTCVFSTYMNKMTPRRGGLYRAHTHTHTHTQGPCAEPNKLFLSGGKA